MTSNESGAGRGGWGGGRGFAVGPNEWVAGCRYTNSHAIRAKTGSSTPILYMM